MGSLSHESISTISERIFHNQQHPDQETQTQSGLLNTRPKNSFRKKNNQVFLEGYVEIPELCNTLPALELCYSMSQKFLLDDQQKSPDPPEESMSETGSPPPSAPIANWKISSPGDDPEEVKARLKYWAQAVACTVKLCNSQLS
ncbi:hypothetical protein HanXRQr2_Chr07g0279271 [Helianthus annuus]|uniref:Uncharacterized protein n=1 Tax=Helianthus annuus TaxID=4232 RepID=A0A9K3IHU7_HELAN|nr:hypothetical protein HanXRQr2_Chr07g0279271 [Helianthus annuus]KAJ0903519.1 hypothetical protein HanPSC8_Chr07g0270861 [Helianthus annuus]